MIDAAAQARRLGWHQTAGTLGFALRRPSFDEPDPRRWPLAIPPEEDDAIVAELQGVAVAAYRVLQTHTREDFETGRSLVGSTSFAYSVRALFPVPLGIGLEARAVAGTFGTFSAKDERYAAGLFDLVHAGGVCARDAVSSIGRAHAGIVLGFDDEAVAASLELPPGAPPFAAQQLGWLMFEVSSVAARIEEARRRAPPSTWRQRVRAEWASFAAARGFTLDEHRFAILSAAGSRPFGLTGDPCANETRLVLTVPVATMITITARASPRAGARFCPSPVAVRSGDDAFDERFWLEGDRDFAQLLGPELRQRLLSIWPATKDFADGTRGLSLENGRLEITLDRFLERGHDLELSADWLHEVARLLTGEQRPVIAPSGPYR